MFLLIILLERAWQIVLSVSIVLFTSLIYLQIIQLGHV